MFSFLRIPKKPTVYVGDLPRKSKDGRFIIIPVSGLKPIKNHWPQKNTISLDPLMIDISNPENPILHTTMWFEGMLDYEEDKDLFARVFRIATLPLLPVKLLAMWGIKMQKIFTGLSLENCLALSVLQNQLPKEDFELLLKACKNKSKTIR